MWNVMDALYSRFVRYESDPTCDCMMAQLRESYATGDALDVQDALNRLRFHWGVQAFAAGLDLGLSLSRELTPPES